MEQDRKFLSGSIGLVVLACIGAVLIPIFLFSDFARRHPASIIALVGFIGKGYEVIAKYLFKPWYTQF